MKIKTGKWYKWNSNAYSIKDIPIKDLFIFVEESRTNQEGYYFFIFCRSKRKEDSVFSSDVRLDSYVELREVFRNIENK